MNTCARAACDIPVTDTTVCPNCVDTLMSALRSVPMLAAELEVTVTRQTCLGGGNGRRGRADTAPLPVDLRAADVAAQLRNALSTTVRMLWDANAPRGWACVRCGLPEDAPGPHPVHCGRLVTVRPLRLTLDCPDTIDGMAGWLGRRPSWIAGHPAGGGIADELALITAAAWRCIDQPPTRLYAGPCNTGDCQADLYHRRGSHHIRCRSCSATHIVSDRSRWIMETVAGMLLDIEEMVGLANMIGHQVSDRAVRSAAWRGNWPVVEVPGRSKLYRARDLSDWLQARELAA